MNEEITTLDPQQTAGRLHALLSKCDRRNSTEAFRQEVAEIITLLEDPDQLDPAAYRIGLLTGHVAEMHGCDTECDQAHWYQADEEATDAYGTLDSIRYRFGYRYMRQRPSNVLAFGADGKVAVA